jgi:DNA sulfur modification protein DndD
LRLESLSAGTRQLIAMSLLWSLLDETGLATLSVVDTPLARLDLEHQERVLGRFLPRCARQVLLLPTNSELDTVKEAALAPSVNETWEIINSDGQDARFRLRGAP